MIEARTGLARALSKLGYCSRTQARLLVRDGRVAVNGQVRHDPESPTRPADHITVDGAAVAASDHVYIMLNKPRGVVTTRSDERDRKTVFDCLKSAALPNLPSLPYVGPVGRLDQASEGLLLLTNDTAWAAAITAPESHLPKTYHVQVRTTAANAEAVTAQLAKGFADRGEPLRAHAARVLRAGERNTWLEIVLLEGRNRQIRRMLEVCGVAVLRLIRVSIGPLVLGNLAKGKWRNLRPSEVESLSIVQQPSQTRPHHRR